MAQDMQGRLIRAGYILAMKVLQSDLYLKLDEEEREAVRLFTLISR